MYFPETDPYEYFRAQVERGEPRLSPSFCHLHAAVAAGLGRRGKVGVVLTPEYGPRQRWISVITTAPLVPDPRLEKEQCIEFIKPGSCQDKCIEVCATEGAKWRAETLAGRRRSGHVRVQLAQFEGRRPLVRPVHRGMPCREGKVLR